MSTNQLENENSQHERGAEEAAIRSSIVQMVGAVEQLLEKLNVQSYSGSNEQNLDFAMRLIRVLEVLEFDIKTLSELRVPVDPSIINEFSSGKSAKKD